MNVSELKKLETTGYSSKLDEIAKKRYRSISES